MILIGDSRAVFGFPPDYPVELAPNILRYKLRYRPTEFARIFLKVANPGDPLETRWEEWYLGVDHDKGILFPWIQKGENKSNTTWQKRITQRKR